MKRKITHIILTLLCAGALFACDRTEEPRTYGLTFDGDNYQIPVGTSQAVIPIRSGNGRYEVSVSDGAVLEATALRLYRGFGEVVINTKSTGRTTLQVKDLRTGEQAVLNVTVYNPHMEISLSSTTATVSGIEDSNMLDELSARLFERATMAPDLKYVLVKDSRCTLYIFGPSTGSDYGELICTGSYDTNMENEGRYALTMSYVRDGRPEEHTYYMTDSMTATIFDSFFELGWRDRSRAEITFNRLGFTEEWTPMFAGDYPGLEAAYLQYETGYRVSRGHSLVPVEMVID